MDKNVNINDFLEGVKTVPSTVQIINLSEFKNFNQIKKGLNIQCDKTTLMQNPVAYQNLFNEVEREIKAEGITLSYTDGGDYFMLSFK